MRSVIAQGVRRSALAQARFASESEYVVKLSQDPEVEKFIKSGTPFLGHFTVDNPALTEHNEAVDKVMAEVNSDSVRLMYLKGDINEPMTQALMQLMKLNEAPAIVAMNKGGLLDTQVGLSNKDFVSKFASKFLEYLGDTSGVAGADDAAAAAASDDADAVDLESNDSKGRFGLLVLAIKKGEVAAMTSDAIAQMKEVIALAQEEVEAERQERKKNPPAPKKKDEKVPELQASQSQVVQANAMLLLADTYQQTAQNELASKTLEAVRKEFGHFKMPTVMHSVATIEMSILCEYVPMPSVEIAKLVAQAPQNLVQQLCLGVSMFKEGKQKEAVALVLQVLRQNKKVNDNAPQKILKCMFTLLGPQDPITTEGQKKMMTYMF